VEPCQDVLVEARGRSTISSSTEQSLAPQSGSISSPPDNSDWYYHIAPSHLHLRSEIRPVVEPGTAFLEGHEKTTDISVTLVTMDIAPLGIPRLEKRFWFQKDRACDPGVIPTQVRPGFSSPTYVVADI